MQVSTVSALHGTALKPVATHADILLCCGCANSASSVRQTISARRWKLDMGLNGKGKDGSRALAMQLFPQSTDLLKCEDVQSNGVEEVAVNIAAAKAAVLALRRLAYI